MQSSPFHPGEVDWSGDNPGIYLKAAPDGPYSTLMVWFRVALSPHGPGHVLVLFEDPSKEGAPRGIANFCIADNLPLARYLIENFCKKFGVFRGAAAFNGLAFIDMAGHQTSGDMKSSSTIVVRAKDLEVQLVWDKLGKPFAADVSPEKSATGKHEMYSVFAESHDASIHVNRRRLDGKPQPRDFMGRQAMSAFLACSETWVRAAQ